MINLENRAAGCLIGLACGDAVGTTVEFMARGSFKPLNDMVGGGVFELPAGAWTDDTSMALCLANSLLEKAGFDARNQLNKYLDWYQVGYMSSIGHCFDIGSAVRQSLEQYKVTKQPCSNLTDPNRAGNGTLMRLAPVPIFYVSSLTDTVKYSELSARTTHAAPETLECTKLFATQLYMALNGASKDDILFRNHYRTTIAKVQDIANGVWRNKTINQIQGTGYVIKSLEAALWCFYTTDNYRDAVLKAANLGNDADTTAAIVGQLAGAYYGLDAIPVNWKSKVFWFDRIKETALSLLDVGLKTNQKETM